jgi:1,4-dihydroxy-2-naphthoate octaprenyltransferase
MAVTFYLGVIALVVVGALPWPALAALGGLPTLIWMLRRFHEPKPAQAPPDNPVWPLWWAPIAFIHTRRTGGLLILGLLAWAIYRAAVSSP